MTIQFGFLGKHRTRLGESPLWDPARNRLWWVDIVGNRIASADADGANPLEWTYDKTVGSIALSDDGLVAALADGFYRIDTASGAATAIAIPEMAPGLRFNDGKADRFGRFFSGTMKPGDMVSKESALWRLNRDGTALRVEGPVVLSNAICFSPDGGTMYFADSLDGFIRRYAYDGATGTLGAREDFLNTQVHGSAPDGTTVDREGRLWVAMFQAQAIACFAPDGSFIRKIDVPLPYPTCPAFGGPDLDIMFVTGVSDSGHTVHIEGPDAGRILTIRGLGAVGLPENRYRPENHIGD